MNHSVPPTREITHIGHYAILDSIGRGGMGLVYLARDTRLDRLVAIKCLRTELFEPHYRERFKREALLLAKLNHPHIVQIYDFIETPEQLGLVMEFVDGQNLQRYLREQIVPFNQRMQWLTQIAEGLAVAHDAGIIHRDLKAENILINKRGEAKISDLGIAKSQDFNATLTEHVTGSYASMSPEQAVGEQLDFRSDLFSFGIIAYQLLCGAHPFGNTDNKLQLMQRIISHPPTSPSKHNPDLPPEICDLLGQLLSKNPDKRPANTHWLAAQCEKLSQLLLTNDLEADYTPALLHPASGDGLNNNTADNSNRSHSGIRKRYTGSTREHATFDTRFEKVSLSQKIRSYLKHNKTQISASCAILLIIAGITFWQLQPKQPSYIAILPPTLSTNEMQESQQDLVKAAVYDAIQQSVLQLDNYYLIPHNEIADINAGNNKEGLEAVRRATAADEVITTDIQCKIEACTITLSRLTPDGKEQTSRLRVQETKIVDVLTDNYLSVATIVQNNVGELYSENVGNMFESIDADDYTKFLQINQHYRTEGENQESLTRLDELKDTTKALPATQTLYSEIALDLHHSTKDEKYLHRIESFIKKSKIQDNESSLKNLFYLNVAKKDFDESSKIAEKIKLKNNGNSSINELNAYLMIAKKDYQNAITFYQKSLSSKKTADIFYRIAVAYVYLGNTEKAKFYTSESLQLSPDFYSALKFYGTIFLMEGKTDSAQQYFKKIYSRNPNDTYNLSNLGLCYLIEKKFKDASFLFDKALKLAPKNTLFILNMADTESLNGNSKNAQDLYQKILDIQQEQEPNKDSLRHIAQAYSHLNRHLDALATLKKLESLDAQNINTIYTAALVHALAKNNSSAIFNIDDALKKGMNIAWFKFSWFDALCGEERFKNIMVSYGESNRCTLQTNL